MRNMRVGDYYQVDMQKDRVISEVHLVCMGGRHPKKYRIEIAKNEAMDSFEDKGTYDGPIHRKFEKPCKFRVIKFTIVEPDIFPNNEPHSWCVYDVTFKEARLFGRLWNVPIGVGR